MFATPRSKQKWYHSRYVPWSTVSFFVPLIPAVGAVLKENRAAKKMARAAGARRPNERRRAPRHVQRQCPAPNTSFTLAITVGGRRDVVINDKRLPAQPGLPGQSFLLWTCLSSSSSSFCSNQ